MAAPSVQVVCVAAFTATLDGDPVVVHEGDMFESTHPLVRGREELFAARDAHGVTTNDTGRRTRGAA